MVLRYGWRVLLVLLLATYGLEWFEYTWVAQGAAGLTMLGYVIYTGAVFKAIVMLVREGRFVGDLADAGLVYTIVLAGLYFVQRFTVPSKAEWELTRHAPNFQSSTLRELAVSPCACYS